MINYTKCTKLIGGGGVEDGADLKIVLWKLPKKNLSETFLFRKLAMLQTRYSSGFLRRKLDFLQTYFSSGNLISSGHISTSTTDTFLLRKLDLLYAHFLSENFISRHTFPPDTFLRRKLDIIQRHFSFGHISPSEP